MTMSDQPSLNAAPSATQEAAANNILPLPDVHMMSRAALRYVERGIAVLPLWWPLADGRCACGNPQCDSVGKHPIGKLVRHGVKDATKDQNKVIRWWNQYPHANIGLACGQISGIVVLDIDGPTGAATLAALLAVHGQTLEPQNFVETGRVDGGRHGYFRYPANTQVPGRKEGGLELKSDGGYVVAPPSLHKSGKRYTWHNLAEDGLEELPQCLIAFARRKEKTAKTAKTKTADGERSLLDDAGILPVYTLAEEKRIRDALKYIPADNRDDWFRIGCALFSTGWGDKARQIFDDWSQTSEKFDEAEQEKLWNSFARGYEGKFITLGTLYFMAKQHGWEEPPPDDIAKLNKQFFAIRKLGGKCVVGEMVPNPLNEGEMLSVQSADAFRLWFLNRKYSLNKKKTLGTAWLSHPQRRQYEGVDLIPGEPQELQDGKLNLWRGFGVEPKQGSWQLMYQHIRNILADGDAKAAEYIMRWTAWKLQHPGERAEVALVLRGGKGAGKGIFLHALRKIFGTHSLHITNQEHLVGKFNAHLRSCLYLFVDEGYWAGDRKAEGVLKGLITESTIMIEQKFVDAMQWPNRLGIVMSSNSDWVVPASHDERRYVCCDINNKYAEGACPDDERIAYFEALRAELDNGGLGAMLHDMLQWKLGNWHPRQIYKTKGLRDQIEQSLPPLEAWFVGLLEEGKLPGGGTWEGMNNFTVARTLQDDLKESAPHAYHFLNKRVIAKYLRDQGCVQHRTSMARGWKFPPLSELRAKWERRYPGWRWELSDVKEWQ
jgi:hypothetical protein